MDVKAAVEQPIRGAVTADTAFTDLLAKRWWILASVVVFAAAFSALAVLIPAKYRAATVLAPASATRVTDGAGLGAQLGGLASLAGGLGLGAKDADTEEALAVLRSREFTESFLLSHNLLPQLYAKKWDASKGTWKAGERQPTPARAYKLFDKKIRTVLADKKTGLVTLQIVWTDRAVAAEWANELVRLLNQEMRGRAIANADASVHFLEKELETTSTVEARNAVGRLMESQVKQRMIAHVTQDYSFRVVDKAMPADADDPVGPTPIVLFIAGPFVGLAVGITLALVWRRFRTPSANQD